MKHHFSVSSMLLSALLLLTPGLVLASPESLARKYPAGSIASVEQADVAIQESQAEIKEIETRYADAEYACYSKFFSSPCVDKAKETRRLSLNMVRPIEVEGKAFKRRETARKRDDLLEEQRARDASEAPARAEQEKINQQKSAQKAADVAARQAAPEKQPLARKPVTPRPESQSAGDGRDRIAEHAARMERARAEEAANEQKRAQNIADYQRKAVESQERQRKVEQKKAEAEQKARERAANATP